MTNDLRLSKIKVPADPSNYYFVSFTSGEHTTEDIVERHNIDIEVLVERSVPLGDVESTGRVRAIKFLKAFAGKL